MIETHIRKLYFIIDTGAEFSLINEGICNPKWKTSIEAIVTSMAIEYKVRTLCTIPSFKEFREENCTFQFLECNFNKNFDGLLGNNILNKLNCKIDYSNRTLRTNNAVVHFFMNKEEELYMNRSYKGNIIEIFTNSVKDNNVCESINTDHLNDVDQNKLITILRKYKIVFYNENDNLTFTNQVKHRIDTKNDIPVYSRIYRYPEIHKDEINKQIEQMLEQGIIRESASPYNSPIWIVPKKLGASNEQKWRLVIDYRKLNSVTTEDRFPIPNMEEIFDKLGRCQYFTSIDLAKGFHQIEMDKRDIHKTAFSTANGHYEFLRMPFGLRNAPATFQRLMNQVLKEYIGKICIVYLDDILIFSTSVDKHLESLTKILARLKETNLKVQLNKCNFLKQETEFLGHLVTKEGIQPNPKKVEAIDKILLPKNQKEIKSFLGITGYYRRFIRDYSKVAYHIIKYLKKNVKINLKDKFYIEAFEKLKLLIKSDPILIHPDFRKEFTLVTDASNVALGAVLMQNNKVICYASRSLNGHEKNYSTIEKELLAIVWATKYFRPYLFGRKFTIKTDHRPLVWLNNLKEPNSKLQRWKIKLNEYDFNIAYIKGKENVIADGLSRIVVDAEVNLNELFEDDLSTVHSAETDSTYFIKITENSINIFKNQLILKYAQKESITKRILYKQKIRTIINVTSESDILEIMRVNLPQKGLTVIYCPDNKLFLHFQELYRNYFASNSKMRVLRSNIILKDITDRGELLTLIEEKHLENNHRGINEVFEEIKRTHYYPKLQVEINKYINNCEICNKAKFDRNPIKHSLNVTKTPGKANDIVHFDIWYPQRGVMFLTSIDKLTKYATAHLLNDRTWVSILDAIKQRIQYLGKPKTLVTDNELDTTPIREFLKDNKIELHLTTTYNKTGNADVERLHSTLNEHVRIFNADAKNVDDLKGKVFKAVISYNNTIHSTTRIRPIDFINNLLSEQDLNTFSEKLHKGKEGKIKALNNKNNRTNDQNFENNYIKNYRVSKSQPKYKKINNFQREGDHLISKNNNFKKVYKTQVKRKFKFQDENVD